MRSFPNPLIEPYRILVGPFATNPGDPASAGFIPGPCGATLKVIFSSFDGWDHVSVSLPKRCPNGPEMCRIKELFFEPEECAMQLHPPTSEHINNHPYCLHISRTLGENGIRTVYGLTGAEAIPMLSKAIEQLGNDVDPDYWKASEGNAKRALCQLRALARLRPDGVFDGD